MAGKLEGQLSGNARKVMRRGPALPALQVAGPRGGVSHSLGAEFGLGAGFHAPLGAF